MKTLLATLLVLFLFVPTAQAGKDPARKVEKAFARLDADHDGRISRAEAAGAERFARRFDKLDADRDGFVTRAELTAAIEKHRRK